MKKTILFVILLLFGGTLAYFGGYYLYVTENPKTELAEPLTVQKAAPQESSTAMEQQEYYFAKLEEDTLMIYRMPDAVVYDSVKASGLHTSATEEARLLEGIRFATLEEVFEFLESAMS